ncbi:hexitol phosphatase HxpB [Marinilongibacter aquaticus]|uniref:hexitol phosphatase HxpB n=1 Tax=Marinilongibacter aquaticus TaxID=2975157 RepID=UPI0021BD27C6|nr:hexitol phosphatase HxpB [Marinilongibacter aquaticus]UBM59909.1 hexitol phosphatase HxpB [Marinilongibacter aquaticus]
MKTLDTGKIEAIIFDMDGLLVNSEPCWHIAEKIAFGKVGLDLTTPMCQLTTGKPVPEVVKFWYERQPWSGRDLKTVEEEIFAEAENAIRAHSTLMPGVREAIAWAEKRGFKIGLASASPMSLIELVLEKFDLKKHFNFYHSAELEAFNKPNPAVYLTVARRLQVDIGNCLILEDSGGGVKGAVASGAQVIAIPDKFEFDEEKFDIANLKIGSLTALPAIFSEQKETISDR